MNSAEFDQRLDAGDSLHDALDLTAARRRGHRLKAQLHGPLARAFRLLMGVGGAAGARAHLLPLLPRRDGNRLLRQLLETALEQLQSLWAQGGPEGVG
jgi:hypothetical protein